MSQRDSVENLIEDYEAFQRTLPICEPNHTTAGLTIFNGNKNKPVHRWFTFKEGFSEQLPYWVLSTFRLRPASFGAILDPFCGVGTSLLSLQSCMPPTASVRLIGIERNPFIRFAAQTKLSWPSYQIERAHRLLSSLSTSLSRTERGPFQVPDLSTLQNPRAFNSKTLQELLGYRERIGQICEGLPEKGLFLLGWSAIIERMSGLRRDGRALRFVDKKNNVSVKEALKVQWENMIDDLETMQNLYPSRLFNESNILDADGRTIDIPEACQEYFDLILYSPPYLNNIDYTEVYKLELWLTGFVQDNQSFYRQRQKTLRSHPSIRFPETALLDNEHSSEEWAVRLRASLLQTVPNDDRHTERVRLFRGYIDDMLLALSRQFALAKPRTHVVCVIGNSLHGRKTQPVLVATDLIVAALGQLVGFEIARLQVARFLRRRDHENRFLRDSIIVFRKP